MNLTLRTPLALLTMALIAPGLRAADGDGWRSLFNGKDLTGWELYLTKPPANADVPDWPRDEKGNYTKPLGLDHDPLHTTFVETVDGEPAIHMTGFVAGGLATKESFGNYHLKLQFKWGQKRKDQRADQTRNAGFLYHAYGDLGAFKERWPSSHQFQIQEGNTGDYVGMGESAIDIPAKKISAKKFAYDPGSELLAFSNKLENGPNCAKVGDYEKPVGEWNTIEVYCVGDSCVQVVNGHTMLKAVHSRKLEGKTWQPLTEGRLELEVEGWEIYFRAIEIQPIKELPAL